MLELPKRVVRFAAVPEIALTFVRLISPEVSLDNATKSDAEGDPVITIASLPKPVKSLEPAS